MYTHEHRYVCAHTDIYAHRLTQADTGVRRLMCAHVDTHPYLSGDSAGTPCSHDRSVDGPAHQGAALFCWGHSQERHPFLTSPGMLSWGPGVPRVLEGSQCPHPWNALGLGGREYCGDLLPEPRAGPWWAPAAAPSLSQPSRRPAHQPPAARLLPADPENRELPQLCEWLRPGHPRPRCREAGRLTPVPRRAATRGTPTASRSARC